MVYMRDDYIYFHWVVMHIGYVRFVYVTTYNLKFKSCSFHLYAITFYVLFTASHS
jgi:hypothetical protein